jgi:hypothetical protein
VTNFLLWLPAAVMITMLYLLGVGTGLAWADVLRARKQGESGAPPRNALLNSAAVYAASLIALAIIVSLQGCDDATVARIASLVVDSLVEPEPGTKETP